MPVCERCNLIRVVVVFVLVSNAKSVTCISNSICFEKKMPTVHPDEYPSMQIDLSEENVTFCERIEQSKKNTLPSSC